MIGLITALTVFFTLGSVMNISQWSIEYARDKKLPNPWGVLIIFIVASILWGILIEMIIK